MEEIQRRDCRRARWLAVSLLRICTVAHDDAPSLLSPPSSFPPLHSFLLHLPFLSHFLPSSLPTLSRPLHPGYQPLYPNVDQSLSCSVISPP